EAGPRGFLTLTVPPEHARDPEAGLTAEQRAAPGPGARVTVLRWVDDWRGGGYAMTASLRGRLRRLDRLAPRDVEHVCAVVVVRGVGCPGIGVEPDGPDVEWSRTCPGAPGVVLRLSAGAVGAPDPRAFMTADQRAAYDGADERAILLG